MPATSATYQPGDLLLGDYPVATRTVTIVSGAGALVRGTVIGKITSGGKYKTALSASSDGSQTPRYILAQDVDASAADATALVYASGDFDSGKLTYGTGITAASAEAAFEAANQPLFLKSLV